MRKSRFTEEQIIGILNEQERGLTTAEVCRKHNISPATFYIYGRLSRRKRLDWISGDLGANIYPASPGLLARPNGKSARREPQQMVGF